MLALLTYSFNHDRIHPFKSLFDMHSMMALDNDEVNAFFELLMKECFTSGIVILPSQVRILNRMKTLILNGNTKAISHSNVLHFKSILQSNPIVKHKLMWISADEYDEFTKVFLELHYDRDFVTEAAAVRKKIRDGMIISEPKHALQIHRVFLKNHILAKRFSQVEPRNIKMII